MFERCYYDRDLKRDRFSSARNLNRKKGALDGVKYALQYSVDRRGKLRGFFNVQTEQPKNSGIRECLIMPDVINVEMQKYLS